MDRANGVLKDSRGGQVWPRPSRVFCARVYTGPKSSAIITAPGEKSGLVLATVTLVTAVTYQFQSWLARILANKRRRSTVVAAAVVAFIILVNVPNLVMNANRDEDPAQGAAFDSNTVETWAIAVNAVLPPGWLALGARSASATQGSTAGVLKDSRGGQVWPGALAVVGLFGIAALSLRRSYRKLLASFAMASTAMASTAIEGAMGGESARDPGDAPARQMSRTGAARPAKVPGPTRSAARKVALAIAEPFLRRIPDDARAVAWAALRLWMRSPQGKMVLLSPILLILLYFLILSQRVSGGWAPHFAVQSMMGLVILMSFNLFANAFGQDGAGFRTVVMAGTAPKDLLLGKNLALASFVLAIAAVALAALQWRNPLPASHFVANVAQLMILYLAGCLLGNQFSIRAPRAMSATSMGTRSSSAAMILATLSFIVLFLLLALPLALPMFIERRMQAAGLPVPVYLLASLLELALAIFIYRRMLARQGRLLAERLQTVLDRVTQPVD